MFFNIDKNLIFNIQQNYFPFLPNFNLKKAVFYKSGESNVANLSFAYKDISSKQDMFRVVPNKAPVRIKIFSIPNQQIKDLISATQKISDLNKILNDYKLVYQDIGLKDFIGDKKDFYKHPVIERRSDPFSGFYIDTIELIYPVQLVLPKKETEYLSFGFCFYADIEDYTKINDIPLEVVDERLITSAIKTFDVFDEKGKNLNRAVVKDIRTVKKIFARNEALEKINEKIIFEYKNINILSENKKSAVSSKVVSDALFTKDTFGNLNLMFWMDYKKIIQENSSFKEYIKVFPAERLPSLSKISSFKVVKRQYELKDKKKVLKKTPVEAVINTSQDLSTNLLTEVSNEMASFKEVTNFFKNFRTIEVVDKNFYKGSDAFYEYGIEIKIADGFYQYLRQLKDTFLEEYQIYKNYLGETNKVINLQKEPQKDLLITEITGYYDPLNGSFTENFYNTVFKEVYETQLSTSLNRFLVALSLFGFLKPKSDFRVNSEKFSNFKQFLETNTGILNFADVDLADALISLLHPQSADYDSISYFIEIYERFLLQIDNILKTVKNRTIDLQYWFTKELIDASDSKFENGQASKQIGYNFFPIEKTLMGIREVTAAPFLDVTNINLQKFVTNDFLSTKNSNLFYQTLAPVEATSKKVSLKFLTLSDIQEKEKQFQRLIDDIKLYKLNKKAYNDFIYSAKNSVELQETFKKSEKILENFSATIKNLYTNEQNISNAVSEQLPNFNKSINSEILMNHLLRNMSVEGRLKDDSFSDLNFIRGSFSKENIETEQELPLFIDALVNKKDQIFTPNSELYLKNTLSYSKFLILYNTIHKVEYLQQDENEISVFKWLPIDYDSIPTNSRILCRLTPYSISNENLKIDKFEEISLPVFDRYFILNKDFSIAAVPEPVDLNINFN